MNRDIVIGLSAMFAVALFVSFIGWWLIAMLFAGIEYIPSQVVGP